jgi:hypothetical protein
LLVAGLLLLLIGHLGWERCAPQLDESIITGMP